MRIIFIFNWSKNYVYGRKSKVSLFQRKSCSFLQIFFLFSLVQVSGFLIWIFYAEFGNHRKNQKCIVCCSQKGLICLRFLLCWYLFIGELLPFQWLRRIALVRRLRVLLCCNGWKLKHLDRAIYIPVMGFYLCSSLLWLELLAVSISLNFCFPSYFMQSRYFGIYIEIM